MAISPTDPISTLTNVQCAQLRDELLALLQAAGLAAPTVKQTRRRMRMGAEAANDRADAAAEAAALAQADLARVAERAALDPIRARRQARLAIDHGDDT